MQPPRSLQIRYPADLPVSQRAEEIIAAIRSHQVLIIAGETGSGKTTQLPKMLLQAGYGSTGRIACTQPRRVAALSVSRRIAEELNVNWGREVGAKIRFTDRTNEHTLIKMMTDGMLLSEIQGDPSLREYAAIILDEAHERSLNIDFLLGYLNQLRHKRPELRIIVTSATIDTATFSKAFGDAPIIEVSGRTWPVHIEYAPLNSTLESTDDFTYIEAAAQAVEDVITRNREGDILVFLPGERDIRELRELLQGRIGTRVELLPLFGRLSNAEQQRIFASCNQRKIILATNIAETSLTIPGIRYVIDAGLARISRYNSSTHTLRLPIESISQSSANQRAGRAGRMAEGVCIRLYSEQEYLSWPKFTTPEILRSNLASVILRMIAFRIGDVETFPFVEPPQERAIRAGYRLLQDLGALDEDKRLTRIGAQLAKLPCDPTVGRMLLQARNEGCTREILVIAAALSIQDPRDRPADKAEEADRMHSRFVDKQSDFLTLLNIWKAYHDETEKLSQSKLRKFCSAHFLSYQRMREWRDIHQQLSQVLSDLDERFHENQDDADYHRIHRALLAGLLTNVGRRDQGNHYLATHNRQVMLFPGSTLFDRKSARTERTQNRGQLKPVKASGKNTPPWILCAEWMETQRLYARTCAGVDPAWICELGRHICTSSYSEPYYEESSERVLVKESVRLYGLEVMVRRVGYGRINAVEATEIFIRSALVDRQLKSPFAFFEHNENVLQTIEERQTRTRTLSAWSIEEQLYELYSSRLKNVSSRQELQQTIRRVHNGNDSFLRFSEAELLGNGVSEEMGEQYPDAVDWQGAKIPLDYTYKPGEEHDGATLKIPLAALQSVDPALLDWAVPGYLQEKVHYLLRALPKETRRKLFPIGDKCTELSGLLRPSREPLVRQLSELLRKQYNVEVHEREWDQSAIPEHLRTRIEILDTSNQTMAAGRNVNEVLQQVKTVASQITREHSGDTQRDIWQMARKRIEKHGLTSWSFADQPEQITIGELNGVPIIACPSLRLESDRRVSLVLVESAATACKYTPAGFRELCTRELSRDLIWQLKDLNKALGPALLSAVAIMPADRLRRVAEGLFIGHLLQQDKWLPLNRARYDQVLADARERARGFSIKLAEGLTAIFQSAHEVHVAAKDIPAMRQQLESLFQADRLERAGWIQVRHLSRYLQAMKVRITRRAQNPLKDVEKELRLKPFLAALQKSPSQGSAEADTFFWLLQELYVQTFAQEIGTAVKVSEKRLQDLIQTL